MIHAVARRCAALLLLAAAITACERPSHDHRADSDGVDESAATWVVSEGGAYRIRISPADGESVVGRFSSWSVVVQTAAGEPVDGLNLTFEAAMPAHGHGMPSAPRVVPADEPGMFVVEGVRLNMAGDWEFLIRMRGTAGADTVVIRRAIAF